MGVILVRDPFGRRDRTYGFMGFEKISEKVQVSINWFTSVDLKDAYFPVPIHPPHRMFLRFALQGVCTAYFPSATKLEGVRTLHGGSDCSTQEVGHSLSHIFSTIRCSLPSRSVPVQHLQDLVFIINGGKKQAVNSARRGLAGLSSELHVFQGTPFETVGH